MNRDAILRLYLVCHEYLKDYPQEDRQLACALKQFCSEVEKKYQLPRRHLTRRERREKERS